MTFEELMSPATWTSRECFFEGPHRDCSTPDTCDCVCHRRDTPTPEDLKSNNVRLRF